MGLLLKINNFLGIKRLINNLLFNLRIYDRETLGYVDVLHRLLVLIRMAAIVLNNWSLYLLAFHFFNLLDRRLYLQKLNFFFLLLLLEPNQSYAAYRRFKGFADIFPRLLKNRVDHSYVRFRLSDLAFG